MSLKLAFKVKAKPVKVSIGNETTGILEVESLGCLTAAESTIVDNASDFDRKKAVAGLAQKIVNKYNAGLPAATSSSKDGDGFGAKKLKMVPTFDAIQHWLNGKANAEEMELIGDYLEDLFELSEAVGKDLTTRNNAYALAILNGRMKQEATIEDMTADLSNALITRLSLFAILEQQGEPYDEDKYFGNTDEATPVEAIVEAELTEEDLGKS